jgi:hypothetical protein
MSLARLKEFLDSHNIKYVAISHSVAYTSQGIAALTHIPGKELAKTVIVKIDGVLAMAVLPASSQVDLSRLSAAAGGNHAVLASEQEFKDRFPDCETGRCLRSEIFTTCASSQTRACAMTRRLHSTQVLIGNLCEWLGEISRDW